MLRRKSVQWIWNSGSCSFGGEEAQRQPLSFLRAFSVAAFPLCRGRDERARTAMWSLSLFTSPDPALLRQLFRLQDQRQAMMQASALQASARTAVRPVLSSHGMPGSYLKENPAGSHCVANAIRNLPW